MQKWERFGIIAAIIAVVSMTAFTSSSLSKGQFGEFPPQPQKIIVKSPIPPVPNARPLNQDPPNCAALRVLDQNRGITHDAPQYLKNWSLCMFGSFQVFRGSPSECEAIDLAILNTPNNPQMATLLSEQATCRRGGIDPAPANQLLQTDGGQLLPKNCVVLEQQNAWGDNKEVDNLQMCRQGNHIMDYAFVKYCDVARFAIASNPAKYFQLADDIDTCNNGGIDN